MTGLRVLGPGSERPRMPSSFGCMGEPDTQAAIVLPPEVSSLLTDQGKAADGQEGKAEDGVRP